MMMDSVNTPTKHNVHKSVSANTQTERPDFTFLYGFLLLIATFLCFISTMYTMIISKFMPETGNTLLDAIKVRNT